jgi:hypothetical protein
MRKNTMRRSVRALIAAAAVAPVLCCSVPASAAQLPPGGGGASATLTASYLSSWGVKSVATFDWDTDDSHLRDVVYKVTVEDNCPADSGEDDVVSTSLSVVESGESTQHSALHEKSFDCLSGLGKGTWSFTVNAGTYTATGYHAIIAVWVHVDILSYKVGSKSGGGSSSAGDDPYYSSAG